MRNRSEVGERGVADFEGHEGHMVGTSMTQYLNLILKLR